eukprot:19651-Heterococcus_DN1.PRE.2
MCARNDSLKIKAHLVTGFISLLMCGKPTRHTADKNALRYIAGIIAITQELDRTEQYDSVEVHAVQRRTE